MDSIRRKRGKRIHSVKPVMIWIIISQNLLQYLTRLRMYDTRVWLTHANALVDSREMVELKHELLTRRQKLRARMEYSVGSIHEMKGEALKKYEQARKQCLSAGADHPQD